MESAPRPQIPSKESEVGKVGEIEHEVHRFRLDEAAHRALLSFDEMPKWFQNDNNQWIVHGYRPISGSISASFQTWVRLHNETVNIHSHLAPAVTFFFGEWYIMRYLTSRYPKVTSADLVAFSLFMLTATICCASSVLYHTLMNHSHTMDRICHRLDMLGIGLFIVGDIVLGVNIIFRCETTLRNAYWCMVVVFGASTIVTNVHPKLQSPNHRSTRTLAFVTTGMTVVAPLIHGLLMFGLDTMNQKAFTYTIAAKVGCLLSGTALYAMRFPESCWPGKFDMCSSHSFMHILVVCAAIIQIVGYLKAFDYAYLHVPCSAP